MLLNNKLGVIVLVLGIGRIACSSASSNLGLRSGSSIWYVDLFILLVTFVIAASIWLKQPRGLQGVAASAAMVDLGVRAMRFYVEFVVIQSREALNSEKLLWVLFEFLPGIVQWTAVLFILIVYSRREQQI